MEDVFEERRRQRRIALNAALGQPQTLFPVVHVAGTNGKGSTVALVAQVLHAAGYRVGRFTSPDLAGPHERFWCAGSELNPTELVALEQAFDPVARRSEGEFGDLPAFGPFERWAAMAWRFFADRRVDVAIVEAGIGGRHDATNVFDRPEATVITAIGRDHADTLGRHRTDVARAKAGIFRPGVPVLTSARWEALAELRCEADRLGAPLTVVHPLKGVPAANEGWQVEIGDGPTLLRLSGQFQLENGGLALATVRSLAERGWRISTAAIREGFATVEWPGRCERIVDEQGGSWLMDGAHNLDGVAALLASWKGPPTGIANTPEVLVVGFRRDKEAAAMVKLLSAQGLPLIIAPIPDAESWLPTDLLEYAVGPAFAASTLEEALQLARRHAPLGLRGVTGSLYLVGAARAQLLNLPTTHGVASAAT